MTTLAALLGALFLKPALVLAGAAAIAGSLRRSSAAARHAVWSGAIIATLALPVLSVTLPPLRITALSSAMVRSLSGVGRSGAIASGVTETRAPLAATRRLSRSGALNGVRPGGTASSRLLPAAILVFWLVGALLFGARRILAEVSVRRIVRRARPASSPRLQRLLGDVSRSVGIRFPAELRLSDEIASPAVAGVIRPALLLPTAAERWTDADVVAVLLHELAHLARRDSLLNLFADVAGTLYWCNPVVRLAVRRMRAESERACDDRVLRGGAEPEGYAQLLLRVASAARMTAGMPDVAIAMARPRELESRLLAVLDSGVARNPLPRWMPAALAGLGVVVALPTAALTLRAAPLPPTPQTAPEPDRLGDSVAAPRSERVPLAPDAYRVSPAAERALAGPDSALARLLIAALDHQPDHEGDLVRERAAWALAQARDGRLVEPLMEALDTRDWRVQAYAAWALASARDSRAVPRLIPLLGHPVWRLRAMAAHALNELHDPRAAAAMNTALTDPAWQVRYEAVGYFAASAGPTRAERLRPRLDDRHVAVRLAAEHALTP